MSDILTYNGNQVSTYTVPALPEAFNDGNTVAWYDFVDAAYVQKDASNFVSAAYNKSFALTDNELVINGGFDTSAGWTAVPGWTYMNNSGTFYHDNTYNAVALSQPISITAGNLYKIEFDTLDSSGATPVKDMLIIFNQNTQQIFGDVFRTNVDGHHIYYLTALVSATSIKFQAYNLANGSSSFSLDNISIKEIPLRSLTQTIANAQPSWSADGVLFDGVNDFLKTAAFIYNQPEHIYIVFKEISYTTNDRVFDGISHNTGAFAEYGAGVGTQFYAVASATLLLGSGFVVGQWHIVRVLFNGVRSKLIRDNVTYSGDTGTNNMGGFILGAGNAGSSFFGNIQVKEVILRNVNDTGYNENSIYNYLRVKYFGDAVAITPKKYVLKYTDILPPLATGGIETIDGGYKIHTFNSSDNFIVTQGGQVDILVIAGGGGGGSGYGGVGGGGGGAGGFLYNTNVDVTAQSYSIVVGGGGASRKGNQGNGGNGGTSSGLGIDASGGGGGGTWPSAKANDGGSGGGGGYLCNIGYGKIGQGNNGGLKGNTYGGGGGGANAVGGNALYGSYGGNGGVGLTSVISRDSKYYAGGGGGAAFLTLGIGGAGGDGGGGAGANAAGAGTAGTANTGGGGGGSSGNATYSGAGGSGIVIIRYRV